MKKFNQMTEKQMSKTNGGLLPLIIAAIVLNATAPRETKNK